MDVFEAIRERRSCRDYLPEPVSDQDIDKILEAGSWAPSPLNMQGWQFIVITNPETREKIFKEADRCRQWALERSGWKWLEKYKLDFLKSVPVIIAVVGDPKKTGVDMFMEDGSTGYQYACAAAIQNMHLAAHAMGLSSLWFTFYDKNNLREILGIDGEKTPISLVCIGKAARDPQKAPRKDVKEKTLYIR